MKILRGSLTETRYEFPDGDKEKQMKLTSETVLANNEVGYMSDELGLHSMSNYGSNYAVSLHRRFFPDEIKKCGHLADVDSIYTAQRGQVRLQYLRRQHRKEDAHCQVRQLLGPWQAYR